MYLYHTFDSTSRTYTWQFDAASRITQMVTPDGTDNLTLDDTDQILGASLGSESYTYDENGNRTNSGCTIGAANQLLGDSTFNCTASGD